MIGPTGRALRRAKYMPRIHLPWLLAEKPNEHGHLRVLTGA